MELRPIDWIMLEVMCFGVLLATEAARLVPWLTFGVRTRKGGSNDGAVLVAWCGLAWWGGREFYVRAGFILLYGASPRVW